jgi:hypothetical protein
MLPKITFTHKNPRIKRGINKVLTGLLIRKASAEEFIEQSISINIALLIIFPFSFIHHEADLPFREFKLHRGFDL